MVKFVLEDFKDCFKVNSIVLQNSIPYRVNVVQADFCECKDLGS